MCTGLEIAALVAAVGGTGAQVAGADAQKRGNARAQDQQTQFSAGEFNIRDQLAKQIFAENTGISREVYDQLNALDDQSFAERTGLSKDAFNQLSEIERQQVVRDAGAAVDNVTQTRDIRTGRENEQAGARTEQYAEEDAARLERDTAQDTARREQYGARDAARAQYEADLAAGNEVQTGYRGQAQSEADALLRAFTPEAMDGRRTSAASVRDAAVQSAITPQVSTSPAGNVDPVLAAAFKRYSDSGREAALANAGARSKVMAYSDATGEGDRAISGTDERVAMIADQARAALAPLSAQLDVSSLKYNNAGALGDARYNAAGQIGETRYGNATARGSSRVNNATANARGRSTAVDADLEAALGLSSTRAGGEARGVTAYTGAQDDALARFFTGRSGSAANRGNTLISANDAKLQGSAQVSQNLENGMNNITQFRAQNQATSPWTTLGQFASAVTPTLFNQAAQSGTGFGFRKPAPATVA